VGSGGCQTNPASQTGATDGRAEQRPPNILLIVGDDHRTATYGAYINNAHTIVADNLYHSIYYRPHNATKIRTPNLDRLADGGIRFDRAYCNSPMCTSSRQSLLTGRYPHAVGVTMLNHKLAESEVTLADRLREAGYRTGAFGKMHFNSNLLHGFEVYRSPEEFARLHGKRPADRPLPEGVEVLPPWRPFRDHARIWLNSSTRPEGRYDSEMRATWYTSEAVAFMREHRDEPFFVQVGYHQPHSPYQFPVEYAGRIDPDRINVPPIGPEDVPQIPKIFADLSYEEKQGIKASYHTAVEYLDQKVGELLEAVNEMHLTENTLVIYLGDHGYHLGEHGRFEKHCFYENAVRAPLVMRYPGHIVRDRSTSSFVEFVDVAPTILDYCGLPHEDGKPGQDIQGQSLRPLIESHSDIRDAVVSEYQPTGEAMIRTDRYKLIYRTSHPPTDWLGYEPLMPPEGRVVLLFDLLHDPDEFHNLARDPDHAETVTDLIGRLEAWYRRIPPKGETPPADLHGMDFLDWAIPPRGDAAGRG
jgi:choline-sulfatase